MTSWSVFNVDKKSNHLESLAFLDPNGGVVVQRYDTMKYRQFEKLTKSSLGFFWQPEEIDLTKDISDFKSLNSFEKHIFRINISRQIMLDSVQGRSPNLAFLPIVSLPEIEAWITTWAFSETIHSASYTHIIRNIYADPSVIFDDMMNIKEITDCANDVSKHYDDLIEMSMWYRLLGEGSHHVNGKSIVVDVYELKKSLWLAINSVNILEGIRFYASFISSWNFAELKKMEGNAKIIKLICRDENLHLASTQLLLKLLKKDDPDYIKICDETQEECVEMFREAVDQEKAWARYMFKDGSMIGLNEQLLCEYLEWVANKRLVSIGLPPIYKTGSNPLPWSQKWIAGNEVQSAPQEVNLSSYVSASVVQDVSKETFSGFSL